MLEAVLNLYDFGYKDLEIDCRCWKSGNILDLRPLNWNWTKEELENPNWRMIRFSMDMSEAEDLMLEEFGDPEINPFLRKRQYYIDIKSLSKSTQEKLFDSNYANSVIEIDVNEIRKAKKSNAPIKNLQVLGSVKQMNGG